MGNRLDLTSEWEGAVKDRLISWIARLAQFCIFVIAALAGQRDRNISDGLTANVAVNGGNQFDDTYDRIIKALPNGTPMKYDDFQRKVGTDITDLLPWATPDTITRNGNHIVLDSAASGTQQLGNGVELKTDKRVEFDLSRANGSFTLTGIKGIKVSIGGAAALDLKELTLTKDSSGNIVVSGKLLVSRYLPYLPFKVTLGPDGQPVK